MKTTKEKVAIMQAYLEGKQLQIETGGDERVWVDFSHSEEPEWNWMSRDYRIKPLEFPKLPEGMEWQIAEQDKPIVTPDFIGAGYRPSVKGEILPKGAQFWSRNRNGWHGSGYIGVESPPQYTVRVPLSTPFPGPPRPKVMVPLGLEDVPPGSVFRREGADGWFAPTEVKEEGIWHRNLGNGVRFTYFTSLQQARYHIKRPGEDWKPCEKESVS